MIFSPNISAPLGFAPVNTDLRMTGGATFSRGQIGEIDWRNAQSFNLKVGDERSGWTTIVRPSVLGSRGAIPQTVTREAIAYGAKGEVCLSGEVYVVDSGTAAVAGDLLTVDDMTSGRRYYGIALENGSETISGYVKVLWDGEDGLGQIVEVSAPGNDPPVAALTATPTTGVAPQLVDLDASASTDDSAIVEYEFDLGQGGGFVSNGSSPTLDLQYYGESGVYQVSVRVTDDGTPPLQDIATVTLTFTNPDGTTGHQQGGPSDPGNGSGSPGSGGTVEH